MDIIGKSIMNLDYPPVRLGTFPYDRSHFNSGYVSVVANNNSVYAGRCTSSTPTFLDVFVEASDDSHTVQQPRRIYESQPGCISHMVSMDDFVYTTIDAYPGLIRRRNQFGDVMDGEHQVPGLVKALTSWNGTLIAVTHFQSENPYRHGHRCLEDSGSVLHVFGADRYPIRNHTLNGIFVTQLLSDDGPECEFGTIKSDGVCRKCNEWELCAGNFMCTAGAFMSAGQCTPCPIDTFKNLIGNGTCEACGDGLGTRGLIGSTMQSACRNTCEPGTYPVNGECVPCLDHAVCKNNRFACLPGFGYWNQQCRRCPSSQYKNTYGNSECMECPPDETSRNEPVAIQCRHPNAPNYGALIAAVGALCGVWVMTIFVGAFMYRYGASRNNGYQPVPIDNPASSKL
jgi:hypothetical protein